MSDNLFGLTATVAHSVFATKIGRCTKRAGYAVSLLPAAQFQALGNAVVAERERGLFRKESIHALGYHGHGGNPFSPPAICADRA
jgi:hypothetical protein